MELHARAGHWGEYFDGRGIKWQEAGEICIMRRLTQFAKYIYNDEVKEGEMSRECRAHERQ
jgi:hypothetical protein